MSERRGRLGVVSGMSVRSLAAVVAVTAVSLVVGPTAVAAFGDTFGVSPINGHPDSVQSAPAVPEADNAFWAMACDRTTAPGLGQPIPAPGIGTYRSTVFAPGVWRRRARLAAIRTGRLGLRFTDSTTGL